MITAVDTSVLIDVLGADPVFGPRSAVALAEAVRAGSVVACDVVWAEVAAWGPSARDLTDALERLGVRFEAMTRDASLTAGLAQARYRRSGGQRHRVVPDFLVGAHASLQADRLLTRDRGFFRGYFEGLRIVDPSKAAEAAIPPAETPSREPPVTSPRALADAYDLLAEGGWTPLAGGTDLMVRITGEIGEPPARMLDIWHLDELRGIALRDEALRIGALTTYTDLRRSDLVATHLPVLAEAAATIGAAQIQNRGTLGGNIVNASPAGDTLPVLLATDARIVLGSARGERSIAAADFWTGYRATARADDELVLRVEVPLPAGREVRFRKVGTRRAQAISKVVMALAWVPDASGAWRDVRVAYGSIAATPVRLTEVEAVLEGGIIGPQVAEQARAAVKASISPIDDVRSTADYRRDVSGRILARALREAGGW